MEYGIADGAEYRPGPAFSRRCVSRSGAGPPAAGAAPGGLRGAACRLTAGTGGARQTALKMTARLP
jgi:hypothetical protein